MNIATVGLNVVRLPEQFVSDDRRVLLRYFETGDESRERSILDCLLNLTEKQVEQALSEICGNFAARHRQIETVFREHYNRVTSGFVDKIEVSEERKLLIGAYFSFEYSIEAAALFNPSIVVHPDQRGLDQGAVRFLMSMRATGEGHISSIVFRRGILHADGRISFDPPPRFAYTAKPHPDRRYDKNLFALKLREMDADIRQFQRVIDRLDDYFTIEQLRVTIGEIEPQVKRTRSFSNAASKALWLAGANYSLYFSRDALPAETVIFPATENERKGMEDLRLVRFHDDDGQAYYYGTYTAFDGVRTTPMMIETGDFTAFHVTTLNGRYAANKGMAFFPRKVGGWYMMVARHDGRNLYLLRSENRHFWNESFLLQVPTESWELMLIGNCGSPVETESGWILLTHGVGPVRRYCIGAMLLDREDPRQVIGRLRQPLLAPTDEEREGYVPNVVYSCGSIIHHDNLVIPYAVSDSRISFATVNVNALLAMLLVNGP